MPGAVPGRPIFSRGQHWCAGSALNRSRQGSIPWAPSILSAYPSGQGLDSSEAGSTPAADFSSGCREAGHPVAFGTQRSQVQILPARSSMRDRSPVDLRARSIWCVRDCEQAQHASLALATLCGRQHRCAGLALNRARRGLTPWPPTISRCSLAAKAAGPYPVIGGSSPFIAIYSTGFGAVWLARSAGGREVVGSKPTSPLPVLPACVAQVVEHSPRKRAVGASSASAGSTFLPLS